MTYKKAEVSLPTDCEVKVVRSFVAPVDLVYKSYTEPHLVERWLLGPPGWSMPICEMDVRVGGSFRWRWRSDDGSKEFGFYGTYLEVQPGSRIVHTEAYDPGSLGGEYPGEDALITVSFASERGGTTLTTLVDYKSKDIRDAALSTGMTDGMEQSYQLLDKLLSE